MKLVYVYHSCFVIEAEGFSVLIDYFRDTSDDPHRGYVHEELIRRPGTLYVLSSHFHPDHFNPEVLEWKKQKEEIRYLFSIDILKRGRARKEDAFYIRKGAVYSDENITVKAFGSTDVGVSFLIEVQGRTLFHAGDLNNWHWKDESTLLEAADAENRYLGELNEIARNVGEVDLVMFPVDPRIGSDFMRGARQFIDRVHTDVFVPMHFWERPSEVEGLASYAQSKGVRYALLSVRGEEIDF